MSSGKGRYRPISDRFQTCFASDLLDAYALERSVRENTLMHYVLVLHDLARWNNVTFEELDDKHFESVAVNRYLRDRAETLSPWTLKQRRISLLVLWKFGNEVEMISRVPRRIRPIKCPPLVIHTWTPDDVRQLLQTAESMDDCFQFSRNMEDWQPIQRGLFFSALIRVAWDTGLRVSDVLTLRWPDVESASGRLLIIQQKTNHPVRVQLTDSTMQALQTLVRHHGRIVCFPAIMRQEHLSREFTKLVARAGLKGNLTTLRKSSATHIEQQAPGLGWVHLGHKSPETTRRWYIDAERAYGERPRPAELGDISSNGSPSNDSGTASSESQRDDGDK